MPQKTFPTNSITLQFHKKMLATTIVNIFLQYTIHSHTEITGYFRILTSFSVASRVQHDFRGTVPSGGNILSQKSGVVPTRIRNPCQTKITYLKQKMLQLSNAQLHSTPFAVNRIKPSTIWGYTRVTTTITQAYNSYL